MAAALLLPGLGNRYLWQDEAQTALLARATLENGIPLGSDGRNSFSQELGAEYGDDGIWKWHPWLSFYLVAASFALFGESAGAARLPFALLGIASVVLTYFTGRALWRDRGSALAAAIMLALCVPFLLLARQSRWYLSATFLSLLALYAYARLAPGSRKPIVLLGVATTLLFHSHYLYAATTLAALLIHAAIFERPKFRGTLIAAAATAGINAPWIVWFSSADYGANYADRLLDPASSLRYARRYLRLAFSDFLHPLFLLVPPGILLWRTLVRRPAAGPDATTWRGVWLLVTYCGVTVVALSLTSPGAYVRYLAPLAPPLLLLAGLAVGAVLRRSRLLGAAVIALWVVVCGNLQPYLHELGHDYDGPIEGIVEFLRLHARAGDTVAITYGDLPVKFYTDLRVVGGLTGEDLTPAANAEWLILRRHAHTREERRVRQILLESLSPDRYDRHVLAVPDIAWGNREDIRIHHFESVRDYEGVVIHGRRR